MALIIRGNAPSSVFGLLGTNENSATYAMGWAMERSSLFFEALLERLTGSSISAEGAVIELQKYGADKGFTDIEIHIGNRFQAILEAKKGWDTPSESQLRKYRSRLETGAAERQMIVSISSADAEILRHSMLRDIDGIEVAHLSWTDVQKVAQTALRTAHSFEEKLWLRHFIEHLGGFVAMDRVTDNTVYVVALSKDAMRSDGPQTWIDVVAKDGYYFHPVGAGWPSQPPHYIGFRYHGKLQSIHRIEDYEIMPDVSAKNPLWYRTESDHFVYRLGKPMRPAQEVRTGNIFMNGKVYCAIDTLLSGEFATISEARDETKRRLASP